MTKSISVHPSYQFAKNMLRGGEYISINQCLSDYQLYEIEAFFDQELAEKNITQAVEDYRNEKQSNLER